MATYDFSAATFTVAEGDANNTTMEVTVTRSGDTTVAEDVTVDLTAGTATVGDDFTAGPITVSFAANETSKAVSIDVVGDIDKIEDDETINLSLSNPTNGGQIGTTNTATLTITEDDDIVRNTMDIGAGSLRQAIIAANNGDSIANPTITFDAMGTGTVPLMSALPDITRDMTIDGPGTADPGTMAPTVTIDGSGYGNVRVFKVNSGVTATFQDLTITNGSADQGGGIFNDGGTVTVQNSVLSNNTATTATPNLGDPAQSIIGGAAIASRNGSLTVTNTTISGSQGAEGQGISFAVTTGTPTLSVSGSTISGGNHDAILVGLFGGDTTINITNNTISGNGQAGPVGDGIGIGFVGPFLTITTTPSATLSITGNTISSNFDEGIDIRFGTNAITTPPIGTSTAANVTGTISNNTLNSNGQNGIQITSDNGGNTFNSTFTISGNTGDENLVLNNATGLGTQVLGVTGYTDVATLAGTTNTLGGGGTDNGTITPV